MLKRIEVEGFWPQDDWSYNEEVCIQPDEPKLYYIFKEDYPGDNGMCTRTCAGRYYEVVEAEDYPHSDMMIIRFIDGKGKICNVFESRTPDGNCIVFGGRLRDECLVEF